MTTYRKNMEGWKPKDLKNKSFENIQELFDKAMKKVNTCVDMDTKFVKESSKKAEVEIAQESSSKRAGEALEQESSKKQKVDDDKETEELKLCMEIIPDDGDDVTVDATPLFVKILIVDYKIYQEGKKSFFQIIRADDMSTSKTYQQSLADVGYENRPLMLERGSYIPWVSRFKRFLNRKRENRKCLIKALEDGPYVFRNITPTGSTIPRLQEEEDLQGDDLLYYSGNETHEYDSSFYFPE
ncbi:hypothetical protein Tco_0500841 [Tanacetum coccineum]